MIHKICTLHTPYHHVHLLCIIYPPSMQYVCNKYATYVSARNLQETCIKHAQNMPAPERDMHCPPARTSGCLAHSCWAPALPLPSTGVSLTSTRFVSNIMVHLLGWNAPDMKLQVYAKICSKHNYDAEICKNMQHYDRCTLAFGICLCICMHYPHWHNFASAG
jgi:hypothetical protein